MGTCQCRSCGEPGEGCGFPAATTASARGDAKLDISPIREFVEMVEHVITVGEFYRPAASGQIVFT